ncbi:hypothetical protein MK805_07310 [Shimazuella sp. AN120528]|uniref:hypothetical protein n=1 Tax=Shimazuella soli TaxID=1892854 RepID=UPI001F10471E|nr:hypothetical protein [Shimazuella soli]MCH5584779.1 hypothetical protein [Shimazuella soli]
MSQELVPEEVVERNGVDWGYRPFHKLLRRANGRPIVILASGNVGGGKSTAIKHYIELVKEFNRTNAKWVKKKYGAPFECVELDADPKGFKGRFPTNKVPLFMDPVVQRFYRLLFDQDQQRHHILIVADSGVNVDQRMGMVLPAKEMGRFVFQFLIDTSFVDAVNGNEIRDRQMEEVVVFRVHDGLPKTWPKMKGLGHFYSEFKVKHTVDDNQVGSEVVRKVKLKKLRALHTRLSAAIELSREKKHLAPLVEPYKDLQKLDVEPLLAKWGDCPEMQEAVENLEKVRLETWSTFGQLAGWEAMRDFLRMIETIRGSVQPMDDRLQHSKGAGEIFAEAEIKLNWSSPGVSQDVFQTALGAFEQAVEGVYEAVQGIEDLSLNIATELKEMEDQIGRRVFDEVRNHWKNKDFLPILMTAHVAVYDAAEYVDKIRKMALCRARDASKIADRLKQRVERVRNA